MYEAEDGSRMVKVQHKCPDGAPTKNRHELSKV